MSCERGRHGPALCFGLGHSEVAQLQHFHLRDDITPLVNFRELNLASSLYPSTHNETNDRDLILCRNVLIYFGRQTVAAIARRLFDSLAVGGWLVTAAADPSLRDLAGFQVVSSPEGVFYRKPVSQAPPHTPHRATKAALSRNASTRKQAVDSSLVSWTQLPARATPVRSQSATSASGSLRTSGRPELKVTRLPRTN